MVMSFTTQMEVLISKDPQQKGEINKRVEAILARHTQGTMPQVLVEVDPRTEQEITTLKRKEALEGVQEDLPQKKEIHQEKRNSYPAEYAKNLHIQDYSDVQTLRSTYQEDQMEQVAYPRIYASSASELYLMSASTLA